MHRLNTGIGKRHKIFTWVKSWDFCSIFEITEITYSNAHAKVKTWTYHLKWFLNLYKFWDIQIHVSFSEFKDPKIPGFIRCIIKFWWKCEFGSPYHLVALSDFHPFFVTLLGMELKMFQPIQFQILENQSRNWTTLWLIVVDHRKILKLKICEVGNKSMVKFLFQSHLMFFLTILIDMFDRTQDSFHQIHLMNAWMVPKTVSKTKNRGIKCWKWKIIYRYKITDHGPNQIIWGQNLVPPYQFGPVQLFGLVQASMVLLSFYSPVKKFIECGICEN